MSTEFSQGDIAQFYNFLGQKLATGSTAISPEQSVAEFRAYQAELQQFMTKTLVADEESRRGLATPLDVDSLMHRVESRLRGDEK